MVKGTASFGRKAGKSKFVVRCRRCGNRSFHRRKKKCSSCGFGATKKIRQYSWKKKKTFPKVIKK